MRIIIQTGEIKATAELNDSETAKQIYDKLPITGTVKTWGDEIYFDIPLHVDAADDAKEEVTVGDLGFWPQGDCFCVFFGKTPASTGENPRAASPVNVFGKIIGDSEVFKQANDGETIEVKKE